MTLRLLLTRSESKAVDKAGDSVIIVVDIWQDEELNEPVQNGDRYAETAKRLTVESLPEPPAVRTARIGTSAVF